MQRESLLPTSGALGWGEGVRCVGLHTYAPRGEGGLLYFMRSREKNTNDNNQHCLLLE